MRISEEALRFLRGEAFSTGYDFRISSPPVGPEVARLGYIKGRVAGCDVIHVGCVDHNPDTIRRKLARGRWLHGVLLETTRHCAGVDLDREGVRFLREDLGIPDVYDCNLLTEDVPWLFAQRWDYLILGEVLEHQDDPVVFLKGLRCRFSGIIDRVIVTVPNAFNMYNFKRAIRQVEEVNSDHRYWFSPYTLAKVLVQADFEIEDVELCAGDEGTRPFPLLKNWILRRYPLFRSRVAATARF